MEWIGGVGAAICFLIGYYSSCPGKVKKVESELKKLRRKHKGETEMSKIISELIGKECIIETNYPDLQCTVLDADHEWIKIMYMDKNIQKIKVLRIESIENVELVSE